MLRRQLTRIEISLRDLQEWEEARRARDQANASPNQEQGMMEQTLVPDLPEVPVDILKKAMEEIIPEIIHERIGYHAKEDPGRLN